jgi:hypothetical protein
MAFRRQRFTSTFYLEALGHRILPTASAVGAFRAVLLPSAVETSMFREDQVATPEPTSIPRVENCLAIEEPLLPPSGPSGPGF